MPYAGNARSSVMWLAVWIAAAAAWSQFSSEEKESLKKSEGPSFRAAQAGIAFAVLNWLAFVRFSSLPVLPFLPFSRFSRSPHPACANGTFLVGCLRTCQPISPSWPPRNPLRRATVSSRSHMPLHQAIPCSITRLALDACDAEYAGEADPRDTAAGYEEFADEDGLADNQPVPF